MSHRSGVTVIERVRHTQRGSQFSHDPGFAILTSKTAPMLTILS
jgi:hypothetical protein